MAAGRRRRYHPDRPPSHAAPPPLARTRSGRVGLPPAARDKTVKVTHPDGSVEYVSPDEWNAERRLQTQARRLIDQVRARSAELRHGRKLPKPVARALAWAEAEKNVEPKVWAAAREIDEAEGITG